MKKIGILFLLLGLLCTACDSDRVVMSAQGEVAMGSGDGLEVSELDDEDHASLIYVYVCGEVEKPGVYSLEQGARICDALSMAGGVTGEGNGEALHQAEYVADGQTIYVPSVVEVSSSEEDNLVNINEADKEMLMTLPGIGESKAELILQYRQEHGSFKSIDELMNIPGIKEGVFDKIKNYIKAS